jgi:tetratricopeptide (TPR) repeat protein
MSLLTAAEPPVFDIDAKATELEQQVRASRYARVAETITEGIEMTRKDGFRVLIKIAAQLTDSPNAVRSLLASCRINWPCVDIDIAAHLHAAGQKEIAASIFERNFSAMDFDTVEPTRLCRGIELAITLQKPGVAAMKDALLRQAEQNQEALSQAVSLAYAYGRMGQMDEAQSLWQTILAMRNGDANLQKNYEKFQKRMRGDPIIPSPPPKPRRILLKPPNADTKARDFDPAIEEAKSLVKTDQKHRIAGLCAQSLAKEANNNVLSTWINIARACATEGDGLTANRVWSLILDIDPKRVFSFLDFSRDFNVKGKNKEIDTLIRRAHTLVPEYRKYGKGRPEIQLRHNRKTNRNILDNPVEIDGVTQSIQDWLSYAGPFAANGDYKRAKYIWLTILEHEHGAMPSVTRGFIRMSTELSADEYMAELDILPTLQRQPDLGKLYRSIAANLNSSDPPLAEQVLTETNTVQPEDAGNAFALSSFLINKRRYKDATEIWFPLRETHALACARCASMLAEKGYNVFAARLFAEVARISPVAALKHGYEFLLNAKRGASTLECIKPLLPIGDEKTLEVYHTYALRLFIKHGAIDLRQVIRKLLASGALRQNDLLQLSEALPVTSAEEAVPERDREVEEYLERRMPDLKTSKFFSSLSERQPVINPGKKTNRAARSVLASPQRLHVPNSHDPKRPRKK